MSHLHQINSNGFTIINQIYTETEIEKLISLIENRTESNPENCIFRKSQDLFAIRQFHKEVPETLNFIFNQNLKDIMEDTFGKGYFIPNPFISTSLRNQIGLWRIIRTLLFLSIKKLRLIILKTGL
ncbi:C2 domain-containing protein [Flavobacterium hydrophilum]|uniref:hypothetical protein n=1 Tax=Flavobacterium hydrophilum TaxID=2211445 RepID=UPI002936F8E4|nr:hypothetical protein [Flavobacterium hydrophilum]